MKMFGVEVIRDGYKYFKVSNGIKYKSLDKIKIESDVAISIHYFAIAALVGGKVKIENIDYNNTKQDYIKFVDILASMGCDVVIESNFIEVSRDINKELQGITIDMKNMKTLTQLLSVVALRCSSETVIYNALTTNDDIDRLEIIQSEFKNIGAIVEVLDEGSIKIIPQKTYNGSTIDTYNDYRTAMAFSLLGTFIEGIFILDEHSITKTYTDYFDVLDTLVGK